MAGEDAASETPMVTPRPMPVRILAALAIVAILVLSMWAVLRAGHNIKRTVSKDLTLQLATTRKLSDSELSAAANVARRRAKALGYDATVGVNGDTVNVATTKKITNDDVRTLSKTGTVENRVVLGQLRADTRLRARRPGTDDPFAGKRCADLVDGKQWFWDDQRPHRACYFLGPV